MSRATVRSVRSQPVIRIRLQVGQVRSNPHLKAWLATAVMRACAAALSRSTALVCRLYSAAVIAVVSITPGAANVLVCFGLSLPTVSVPLTFRALRRLCQWQHCISSCRVATGNNANQRFSRKPAHLQCALARTGPSLHDSTKRTTTAPVASRTARGPRSLDTLLRSEARHRSARVSLPQPCRPLGSSGTWVLFGHVNERLVAGTDHILGPRNVC